jgi:hypothetical protein
MAIRSDPFKARDEKSIGAGGCSFAFRIERVFRITPGVRQCEHISLHG